MATDKKINIATQPATTTNNSNSGGNIQNATQSTSNQPQTSTTNTNNNNNINTFSGHNSAKRTSSVVEHHQFTGNWCCLPCYWLRNNNSFHKVSLALATLLVTSLLVASPVLFLISAVPASDVPPKDCRFIPDDSCFLTDGSTAAVSAILGPECAEPQCVSASQRILAALDTSADPCSDFQRYSCGRWKQDGGGHSLADMQRSVDIHIKKLLENTGSGRYEKLGLFYKSCLDVAKKPTNFTPMFNLLDKLGGYLPPGTLGPTDLTPILTNIFLLDGSPLFNIKLIRNPSSKYKFTVLITPPKIIRKFPQISENITNQILGGFIPSGTIQILKTKEENNILDFIKNLEGLNPDLRTINLEKTPNTFNISRLQILYPIIKWCNVFETVLNWTCIDKNVSIYINSPNYLTNLNALLQKVPKRVIHNSILVIFSKNKIFDLFFHENRDQNFFCTKLTYNIFGYSVGQLYFKQYPSNYIKNLEERTENLFGRLKNSLGERIRAAMWLDDVSKSMALKKLKEVKLVFYGRNGANATDSTEMNDVDSNDFFGTVLRRYEHSRRKFTDKPEELPHLIQPAYDPIDNTITIPLSLLVQPHFRLDLPSSLWYATVGQIIGHYLLHGLDMENEAKFLPDSARLGLAARVHCLSMQPKIPIHQSTNQSFESIDSSAESMVDIGALHATHRAWIVQHTGPGRLNGLVLAPGQLFHVIVAQLYCAVPDIDGVHQQPQRINGIMMNSPSFSEAFDCPVGSPMNPLKKCSTW